MHILSPFLPNIATAVDAIPAHGKIRTCYFRGFKNVVRKLGGDPFKLLERLDLDPLAFESADYDIECSSAVNLFEYCSHSLDAPLFGLQLAEQQEPDAFGCAMTLARAAPTLREAVQSLVDYVPLTTSPECEIELVTGRDVVEIRWHSDVGLGDRGQAHYQGLLLFMKALRTLGGNEFRPRYATLAFPIKPQQARQLEERLGCLVRGRAQANAIAFPVEALDRRVPTADRMLFSLLGGSLPQLRAAARPDFVARVQAHVRRKLQCEGSCSVKDCAEHLGTSARTLQKRLAQGGVSFSDIVQTERVELAKHALQWSGATLDEIAFQLGYAEQTTFGRAFKRATGLTPQAFRLATAPRSA